MTDPRHEYEVRVTGGQTKTIKADDFHVAEGFVQFLVVRGTGDERVAAFPSSQVKSVTTKAPS